MLQMVVLEVWCFTGMRLSCNLCLFVCLFFFFLNDQDYIIWYFVLLCVCLFVCLVVRSFVRLLVFLFVCLLVFVLFFVCLFVLFCVFFFSIFEMTKATLYGTK